MQNINIDTISLKILKLLQENSRISFVEIGKEVNLSSSSVAERIKKLEESGIISQYTININPKAMDMGIQAIMMVSISGVFGFHEKAFVESVLKLPQVIECLRITGSCDFMIKVITNSVEDLRLINDEVGKFGQVNTSIVIADFLESGSVNINRMTKNINDKTNEYVD